MMFMIVHCNNNVLFFPLSFPVHFITVSVAQRSECACVHSFPIVGVISLDYFRVRIISFRLVSLVSVHPSFRFIFLR